MVLVRDLVIGNKYIIDGKKGTLVSKKEEGAGGTGGQEPYYKLIFTFDSGETKEYTKDWDEKYDESKFGGKRKTKRSRKMNKSRKSKHNRR